jgi:hypothetical protein
VGQFGVAAAGQGTAVVYNPRTICLQAHCLPGARVWLGDKECLPDRTVRLKPGFYTYRLEYRADVTKPVLPVSFREVADPAVEMERWEARVRRNRLLLDTVAASRR